MLKAIIDFNLCLSSQCKECLARQACPIKAIHRLEKGEAAIVELNRCDGCGQCVKECPVEAIFLNEI